MPRRLGLLAAALLCVLLLGCASQSPVVPQRIDAWSTVTVGVGDLDIALNLWVDTFGFQVVDRRTGPDQALADLWGIHAEDIVEQALVRTGESQFGMIHFIEFDDPDPPVRQQAEVFDMVPKNLDVYVDDMPRRFVELSSRGVHFRTHTYSEVTAPDGTAFREIHMPSHDAINVVLLEVVGKPRPFTANGFAGVGPLIYIVPDAPGEKAFAESVLRLDKLNDNLLKGPEIERMVGLPPGSGLDVSIWGRSSNVFGDIEIIEYQGVRGKNLYPMAVPKALGILHISYAIADATALLTRLDAAGTRVTSHGYLETLSGTGRVYSFSTPAGLRIEVYEYAKTAH